MLHTTGRPPGPLTRYYALRGIGWVSDQVLLFLVPVFTYRLTGSLAWSSLALTAQWAPRLLALPIGGLLSDRLHDRTFYLLNDALRSMAGCGAAALALAFPDLAGLAFIGFAVIAGITCEQVLIAGDKLAARLVPPGAMSRVQSVLGGIEQSSMLAAPALGGGLLLFDTVWVVLTVSALFGVSMLVTLTLPKAPGVPPASRRAAAGLPAPRAAGRGPAAPAPSEAPARPGAESAPEGAPEPPLRRLARDVAAGLRGIVAIPLLAHVVLATMCVNLLLGTVQGAAPDIVVRGFGGSEDSLGTVYTAAALVAMAALVVVPRLIRRFGLVAIGSAATLVMGTVFAALSTMTSFPVFAALVVVFLAANGVFAVFIRTVRIALLPPEDFGRIVSVVFMLNYAPVPLVGLLLASLGPRVPLGLFIGVLGTLVLGALTVLAVRMRRLAADTPVFAPGADAAGSEDPVPQQMTV
ncbi:MFS transporter [Streptomyces sp. NPDC050560]|uniref:MFS transporter n=1 Tax=Streptomyces sp. NPDC050560 TaxID=3365630 RepID=UPI00379A83EF